MKNKKGFILSTYVYILLVFFLLLLSTMLAVLNNTRLLSNKLKEQSSSTSGLANKDFSFVLLGDKDMTLFKGDEFIDPGYIIKTSGGHDLSNIVKVTGSVNSDTAGMYELTYTATYNGVTKTLSRNVEVVMLPTAVEKIESLAITGNTEGLIPDDTTDHNIRYAGGSPKNYISFNNELWRIIGTFNVTTSSGNTEKLVKIVRDSSIGSYSWDSSTGNNNGAHGTGEVNDGYGVNQWGSSTYTNGSTYEGADLMRELNSFYLNSQSGTCYNGFNNLTTSCNFSEIGIKDAYRSMIETVIWSTGAFGLETSALAAYGQERGTTTGKSCTSGAPNSAVYCTDSVNRTTTWQGKVGLIYPSDYGYASTNTSCRGKINEDSSYSCKNDNWLHINLTYWTISPVARPDLSVSAWCTSSDGHISNYYGGASVSAGVRPTVYLKSDVSIIGGDGSSTNPYKISMN